MEDEQYGESAFTTSRPRGGYYFGLLLFITASLVLAAWSFVELSIG